jgi:hypothetical protein
MRHCDLVALRPGGIATWWHCDLVALRPGGIATWWHCDLVALRPGGIAFTSHCAYFALLSFTCIADHCQLPALPIPGTIAAPSGTIRRWCRRHCDLAALRPGGIATWWHRGHEASRP